jgi:hypothetical protein
VNSWHVSGPDLAAYLSGTGGPVLDASVEAHVIACARCRGTVAVAGGATARADSERRWAALVEQIDRPAGSALARWTGAHVSLVARASVSSRPLLAAWLSALVLVLLLPVLPVVLAGREATTALLAVAPLAPVAAVVLAYRRSTDPAGELALATPLAGFRLVATRALLVAVAAAPAGVLLGLALDLPAYVAFGWLLPGLALSALVLVAGTMRLDPTVAAAVLGGGWAAGVALTSLSHRGSPALVAELVTSSGTQLLTLAVALAAFALAFARRDHVTYRRTA